MNNKSCLRASSLRRVLPLVLALGFALARPMTTDAEITIDTKKYDNPWANPAPTQANKDLLISAVYRLANHPKLANHPIRRFLNDPQVKAQIIFDNPRLAEIGNGAFSAAASVDKNIMSLSSNKDLAYYLENLIHEFIHIAMNDKYGDTAKLSFLTPEDYAFQNMMEESFSKALDLWGALTFPEIPNNPNIRNWQRQNSFIDITEAMRNDYKAQYGYSDEVINDMVAREMFDMFMTRAGTYSLEAVPSNLVFEYGQKNTFLIPEYAAYRANADALLRHQWNYLASMMPFELKSSQTYDSYRRRFRNDAQSWAQLAQKPEDSIWYWMNYDYVGNAQRKLASQAEEFIRYNYLTGKDEERLNRVMLEINPYFKPVDTWITNQRLWQTHLENMYDR